VTWRTHSCVPRRDSSRRLWVDPRLILLLALAFPLSAQSVSQDQELREAAKNPYDLARFIDSHLNFDWEPLWKALGSESLLIQPCGKLSNGREGCSTELITVLDPDQVIVLIQGDATPADIYLRFMRGDAGTWRFAGAHPAFIHNHPRRHEVARFGGKPFLRVSGQGVSGSDEDSEVEDWFDLSQPGLTPVFSFPVQGNQRRLGFGIGRRVFTYLNGSADRIDVTLEVQFMAFDHELGIAEFSAVYKRAPGTEKFAFAAVKGSCRKQSSRIWPTSTKDRPMKTFFDTRCRSCEAASRISTSPQRTSSGTSRSNCATPPRFANSRGFFVSRAQLHL